MITLFNIRPKGFNIGNDAIHVGLRHMLQEAFGRVVNIIELPAVSRYESHGKAGLTPSTINEINRIGDGVIVGGGNLYENNELTVDTTALNALTPPMLLFSMSRGRVYDRKLQLTERTDVMPDPTIAALNNSAAFSLARDSQTEQHIRSLGCSSVRLGGCPTIFLNHCVPRLPELPEEEVAGALISIRTPSIMNLPLRMQSVVHLDLCDMIDELRRRGYGRIRILCNDSRDVEFGSMFQALRGVDFVYTSDVYWYLSLLNAANLVISYRLHASLPCFAFDTPCINISYDERAESLIDDLGFGEWNINMVNKPNVMDEVSDRLGRLDQLREIKASAQPIWNQVKKIQTETLGEFASAVKQYTRESNAQVPLKVRSAA